MIYIINTQKNLAGTVEGDDVMISNFLWHLETPVKKDITFGDTIQSGTKNKNMPGTWVDPTTGYEEMAIISGEYIFLSQNLSGGAGYAIKTSEAVSIKYTDKMTAQITVPVTTIVHPKEGIRKIDTIKDLTGTVEQTIGSLTWDTNKGKLLYGMQDDIPCTYLRKGIEEVAVIRGNVVFLDENFSGNVGEKEVSINDIVKIREKTGYTTQIELKSASAPCTPGSTREVTCPKTKQKIIQTCIEGKWVTSKSEEKKCGSGDTEIMTILYIIIVLLIIYYLMRK